MLKKIICAGFGGQGVLTVGKIIMYAAHKKGFKVTWFPSYGNEMRGGSANCHVIMSSERIASPYADHPDILMALNEAAVTRFMPTMLPGGQLFVNSSLVNQDLVYRDDIEVYQAPVSETATSIQNERAANLCMLGFIVKKTGLFLMEELTQNLCDFFEEAGKGKFNQGNVKALEAGYALG